MIWFWVCVAFCYFFFFSSSFFWFSLAFCTACSRARYIIITVIILLFTLIQPIRAFNNRRRFSFSEIYTRIKWWCGGHLTSKRNNSYAFINWAHILFSQERRKRSEEKLTLWMVSECVWNADVFDVKHVPFVGFTKIWRWIVQHTHKHK